MSSQNKLRAVGLTTGYKNKDYDIGDVPIDEAHNHLYNKSPGRTQRMLLISENDQGTLQISDYSVNKQGWQNHLVETIHHVNEGTWDLLNKNIDHAIHPGGHGYAEDSNFMYIDFDIQRRQNQPVIEENTMPHTASANENFLIQSKLTNNETNLTDCRDLIYDTIQSHLTDNIKSSRIFIASETEGGEVHISHIALEDNFGSSSVNNYMFTHGADMFANLTQGFDNAITAIEQGNLGFQPYTLNEKN